MENVGAADVIDPRLRIGPIDFFSQQTMADSVVKGLSLAGLTASLNVESRVRAEPTDHKASDVVAHFVDLFNGRDLSGWVNVNTRPDTWKVKDGLLVCSGKPIGVMRSEKLHEDFILHIDSVVKCYCIFHQE